MTGRHAPSAHCGSFRPPPHSGESISIKQFGVSSDFLLRATSALKRNRTTFALSGLSMIPIERGNPARSSMAEGPPCPTKRIFNS